jgi:hypothetical protein
MDPEQREKRLQQQRERRQNMDPEERERHLEQQRERRQTMDPEQREKYLERKRKQGKERRQNMDPEQRENHLKRRLERYQNMDPEEREKHLEQGRERYQNNLDEICERRRQKIIEHSIVAQKAAGRKGQLPLRHDKDDFSCAKDILKDSEDTTPKLHVSTIGPHELRTIDGHDPGTLFPGSMVGNQNGLHPTKKLWLGLTIKGALHFSEVNNNRHWCTKGYDLYLYAVHPNNPRYHTIHQHYWYGGENRGVLGTHTEFYMYTVVPILPDACWQGTKHKESGLYSWIKVYVSEKLFPANAF